MNVQRIAPGEDFIEKVADSLIGSGHDFGMNLVVFPGKRPAHYLRKSLALRIGTSYLPPRVYSMDEWIDFLNLSSESGRTLETVDAVAILYDIHRSGPGEFNHSEWMTPDAFLPLGIKIYRELEELTIEGVSPEQLRGVEAFLPDGVPRQTQERLYSLSQFYETFYRKVGEMGFSTRSVRYQSAARMIDQGGLERFHRVVIAGFFALTEAERKLFRKILPFPNVRFLFQEGSGLDEALSRIGVTVNPSEKKSALPEVHFYSSPDTHGQVLALNRILNAFPEDRELLNEDNAIVLPSPETLFPLLRQALSGLREDQFNISLGYPLFRTPVFGFINSLMDLISSADEDRIYIPDYLKFVLHPYTKNIYFRKNSETTRILFHTIEETLLNRAPITFCTLAEIEEDENLYIKLNQKLEGEEAPLTALELKRHLQEIHHRTIGTFLSFRHIGDFARCCSELLLFIFNNSPAKNHPLFHPFTDTLIQVLDQLQRSLMKEFTFANISSYFIFLRKFITTCHIPFTGTPLNGIQVLGMLETRNLKFKRVFLLDANEEVLPETRKEENLIPLKAREILKLPTYLDRDRIAGHFFDTLIYSAESIHLFFVEDGQKERSRFVERLLWEKQKNDRTVEPERYIRPIQYRINLSHGAPESIRKTPEILKSLEGYSISATSLDEYLRCPLKFYYHNVLGVIAKGRLTGEIDRSELGTFVHLVMHKYFTAKLGRILSESDLVPDEMESLVDQVFTQEFGKNATGPLYLTKRQIKRHLAEFVKNYSLPLVRESRVTVLGCEERISTTVDGYSIKGTIDLVERRDHRTMIIDYKTGSSLLRHRINLSKLDLNRRDTWPEAIGSLQLPFYILLYMSQKKTPVTDLDALYLHLGRLKLGKEIEVSLFGTSDPEETFSPLKTIILKLLEEVRDPEVPFFPTKNKERNCPGCDYKTICGTQWVES